MAPPFQGITIGGHIPARSVLHALDCRLKLIGLIVLLVSILTQSAGVAVALNAVMIALLMGFSGIGARVCIWAVSKFTWMLVIVAAAHLFFNPWGRPIVVLSRELPFTVEAVSTAALWTLTVAEAVIASMTLTFTTGPRDISGACVWLASPLSRVGVKVQDLGLVILLAMKHLPMLQGEISSIVEAQKARGIDFDGRGIAARAKSFIPVLLPALTGALRRSDTLAAAMKARGFKPNAPRSQYKPPLFARRDYTAACFLTAFALAQGLLR